MSIKDNKMDGFLEPGISLALRMDQYPGLPSVDEDPTTPSLNERSRTLSLVEQDSSFLLNDDLRLPRIVEMEEFTRRFVRNNDRTQQQGLNTSDSDNSNATAETVFTYGTNDDNYDNNNDGDDNNSDENFGNEEPNNNNRYVYNRNINVSIASVNQDHEDDEELESEPSDLFCGTICNETFQQMNRSQERARMSGYHDDCWNPIEPLLTSSTLAATANVTAASIKSPGSTLAGNITPSSLKNMQAMSNSSWNVNHLHLLRTVSDIDTSIGEEDFKDCVEAILKQCNEEESVERSDVLQGTSTADVDVVYLSDLSSCSSFGSCFDDMDRSKLVTDPETLSFETCFDQSGVLKVSPIYHPHQNVQQKVKRTSHSSPKQTSTGRPSPASATNDFEQDPENDLSKASPSDQNSLLNSFEMIKSPEIKKTIESMLHSSCRSDFVSMDQSESSLSKLDEARETLIQNFRGTKKQLRSSLSSLARWINSDSEEENDVNLAEKLKVEVTSKVNVSSEVKVTPPTVEVLSRVKRLEAVDMGNIDGDFHREESFVVIHNTACKRSLPLEAEKTRCHQMDCKRQISFESCRTFDRTNSQEGLLSDTESHIHDQLDGDVNKGNSTCSVM